MIISGLAAVCRLVVAICLPAASPGAQAADYNPARAVDFPVGCRPAAAVNVERGVAWLHNMMYARARASFAAAEDSDPGCAIALWGTAMTYIHPLWPDRPSPEVLAKGADLATRAVAIGGHDGREAGYIATTVVYFVNGRTRSEAARLARFEAAWKQLHQANPGDLEAAAFYVLAQLATADSGDRTHAKRLHAGALAEQLLVEAPDHPGAHHYIIHAYDVPELAPRALAVARNYGLVAPEAAHAQHMMSHIFTQLGLWDESIEWSRRSTDAAWQLGLAQGAVSIHYLHAVDFLVYAHLQKGEDGKALEIISGIASLSGPFGTVNRDAQAAAFAAAPARYALERGDWAAAAALQPRMPARFPWGPNHAPYIAVTHFARGLGLARLGRFEEAAIEVATLARIRRRTMARSPYWATQVEIQRLAVEAWAIFLSGDGKNGLSLMKAAATMDTGTERSAVYPGSILPASELLGDMLAAMGLDEQAVAAYRKALIAAPRRLNSLYGAARALERMENLQAAGAYHAQIVAMVDKTSSRASIIHALKF